MKLSLHISSLRLFFKVRNKKLHQCLFWLLRPYHSDAVWSTSIIQLSHLYWDSWNTLYLRKHDLTRTHLLCRAWLLQLEKPMCHHEQLVYGNPLEYPCHLCCAIPQIHSNSSGVFLLAEQFANLICNLPMLKKGKLCGWRGGMQWWQLGHHSAWRRWWYTIKIQNGLWACLVLLQWAVN